MIQPSQGYQPACFAVAYRLTKDALRKGQYLSKHQMFQDIMANDPFVWRHDGLIKSGIARAYKEYREV